MLRLVILEEYIATCLRRNTSNGDHKRSCEESLVLKEICCALDYVKEVTVGIQGGNGGTIRRSILLCNELVSIFSLDSLEQFDFKKIRETKGGGGLPAKAMKPITER